MPRRISDDTLYSVILVLTTASILTAIHLYIPQTIQQQLVFDHSEFAWYTLWTSAYVHQDLVHLHGNLVGFLVVILALGILYDHRDRQQILRWSFIAFIVFFPVLVSLSNYVIFYHIFETKNAATRGFSGVVAGLFGLLLASLIEFVWDRTSIKEASGIGLAIILSTMVMMLVIAGEASLQLILLGGFGVLLSLLLGIPWDNIRHPRVLLSGAMDNLEDVAIVSFETLSLVLLLPLLFPLSWVGENSLTNIFGHFAGLLLGVLYGALLGLVHTERGQIALRKRDILNLRSRIMTEQLGSGWENPVRVANRLWAGRYGRGVGIGIGLFTAVMVAAGGYLLGPRIHPFLPVYPPFSFRAGELHLLWGVHATVISLSLVGLSFAWNSVHGLPTVKEIIEEITFRLRSIETITFLLASNLCIGIGILISDGTYVSLDVGYAVGLLLVVSFGVTIRRFWVVFDLLLHNTLDETVSRFAEDAITGRFGEVDDRYESYLAHFFQHAKKDIDQDRPEQLRETLRHVEELLDQVLWEDSPVLDESQIWRDAINNYAALHRRCIKQQNEELEQQTISSLHGATLIALRYERRDLIEQSLQAHTRLFVQEYSVNPQGQTIEFLLDRFEIAQTQIFMAFERADDRDSLESASLLVDALMRAHATLWKTVIENEDRGALKHVHYLLEDVYQFRPYTYLNAFDQHVADEGDENIEFREGKQEYADLYRDEINRLRFVTYGWVLFLYREGDVSDRFVNHVFTEYVEDDFGSISDLSGTYFQLVEEAEILDYWERWNMDRELDRSHGVATTGMAANTWLLEFCCTAIVWVIDSDEKVGQLQDLDAERSPLTEYEQIGFRVGKIIDLLDSYHSEYPLDGIVGEEPPVAERCDALVEYFERVKELLDEQEQENIREMPIFEDAVENFANSVNSQMSSCKLRTGIQEVVDIAGIDSLDEDGSDGFTLSASMARRLFVDDGIPTTFSSSFSDVLDRYREFVIDHLNLEERELDSVADLPNVLAEVAEQDDVVVFVVDLDGTADVLREDERSERTPNSEIHSFFDFAGVPVLTDLTTDYVAVALYDDVFEYVEERVDGNPIGVSVTPGEDVDEWAEADAPEGMVPQDFAKVDCSYRARIETHDVNGIVFCVAE